jgi:ubiquinone/menaquinone biosynthesis C-methylase UbiE
VAFKLGQETFKGGIFKVGTADDLMMSDKSLDVLLTDMTMIYVGPRQIGKHLKEYRRVARKEVVFCEFHERSWWKRIWLHYKTGYFFYNWADQLKKYGFYDITIMKLPGNAWPGGLQEKHCYLIKAKTPKRYV